MQLGILLANLQHERDAIMALEAVGDLVLYAEVLAAGARFGEAPAEYVSGAVRRYASRASGEDWLGLMSAVERGDDPARTVLQRMLRWALAQDDAEGVAANGGCSCKDAP